MLPRSSFQIFITVVLVRLRIRTFFLALGGRFLCNSSYSCYQLVHLISKLGRETCLGIKCKPVYSIDYTSICSCSCFCCTADSCCWGAPCDSDGSTSLKEAMIEATDLSSPLTGTLVLRLSELTELGGASDQRFLLRFFPITSGDEDITVEGTNG